MSAFIHKIYAFQFLNDLMLIYPFYALMMQEAGVDIFQLSLLFVIWGAVSLILEVPSGVLADKYSRKKILIAAQLFKATAFSLWLLMPTFWGFAAGFVMWGAAGALRSGTFEALLYDELAKFGHKEKYAKYFGRAKSAEYLGFIISAALASSAFILGGYALTIAASIVALFASIFVLFTLPKAKKVKSTLEVEYFTHLKKGVVEALRNPILLRLIIFTSLIIALEAPIDEYYNIFANSAGIPKEYVGLLFALVGTIDITGALVAHKLEKRSNTVYYLLFAVEGALIVAAATLFSPVGVLLLIASGFTARIVKININAKLQHATPTHIRATVSSTKGFFTEISSMAILLSFGIYANQAIKFGFQAIGWTIIGVSILYLLQRQLRKRGWIKLTRA